MNAIGSLNRLKTIRIAGDGIRATSLIHHLVSTPRTAYQLVRTVLQPKRRATPRRVSLSVSIQFDTPYGSRA
jgi:hypothetical protein